MTNITLRSVKGSPLTNNEVDSNFSSLNDYKVEQTDSTGSALIPSGTTAQRDGSPSAGMFRYNSDLGQFEGYTTVWGAIGGGSVDSAIIQGIIDSDWTTRGINDLSDGYYAGLSYGLGTGALSSDDGTTNKNTAVGYDALSTVSTGVGNTALGYSAGRYAKGNSNVALGEETLRGNTTLFTGDYNIGAGYFSGYNLTTGSNNVLLGQNAGYDITEGGNNVAIGQSAGTNITSGNNVISIGNFAGYTTTTASEAVYIGYRAGWQATSADNTIVGSRAGWDVTTGAQNTIIGDNAGNSGTNNLTTGSNNILLGYQAAASDSAVSNEITIGNTSITSFRIPGLQSTATHGQVLTFDSDADDIAFTTVAAGGGGLDSADLTNGTFTGKVIFDSAQVNGIEFKSPSTTHTMTLDLDNNDILRLTNGTTDLITIQDSGAGSTIFSVQDGGTEYFKVDTSGFTAFVNHAIGSQTLTTTSTSQTAIATFAHASYIGAEAVITAKDGIHSHITKLNIIHDGTTAYSTEYGSLFDSASLSTYDVDISGADLRILATPASTNSTVFRVALTLMDI